VVFTNNGVNVIRNWLAGSAATAPTHIAYGSDGTAPSKGDTTLTTELTRAAFDSTTASADKEVKFEGVLGTLSQNGQTLRECGLFNAGAGGTLFARNTFTDLAKTSSIELQIFITVRVEN